MRQGGWSNDDDDDRESVENNLFYEKKGLPGITLFVIATSRYVTLMTTPQKFAFI